VLGQGHQFSGERNAISGFKHGQLVLGDRGSGLGDRCAFVKPAPLGADVAVDIPSMLPCWLFIQHFTQSPAWTDHLFICRSETAEPGARGWLIVSSPPDLYTFHAAGPFELTCVAWLGIVFVWRCSPNSPGCASASRLKEPKRLSTCLKSCTCRRG
jgi:hypothetical protein